MRLHGAKLRSPPTKDIHCREPRTKTQWSILIVLSGLISVLLVALSGQLCGPPIGEAFATPIGAAENEENLPSLDPQVEESNGSFAKLNHLCSHRASASSRSSLLRAFQFSEFRELPLADLIEEDIIELSNAKPMNATSASHRVISFSSEPEHDDFLAVVQDGSLHLVSSEGKVLWSYQANTELTATDYSRVPEEADDPAAENARRLISGSDGFLYFYADDGDVIPLHVHVKDIVVHAPFSTPLFPKVYFIGKREASVKALDYATGVPIDVGGMPEAAPALRIGHKKWIFEAIDIKTHVERWKIEWSEVSPIITLGHSRRPDDRSTFGSQAHQSAAPFAGPSLLQSEFPGQRATDTGSPTYMTLPSREMLKIADSPSLSSALKPALVFKDTTLASKTLATPSNRFQSLQTSSGKLVEPRFHESASGVDKDAVSSAKYPEYMLFRHVKTQGLQPISTQQFLSFLDFPLNPCTSSSALEMKYGCIVSDENMIIVRVNEPKSSAGRPGMWGTDPRNAERSMLDVSTYQFKFPSPIVALYSVKHSSDPLVKLVDTNLLEILEQHERTPPEVVLLGTANASPACVNTTQTLPQTLLHQKPTTAEDPQLAGSASASAATSTKLIDFLCESAQQNLHNVSCTPQKDPLKLSPPLRQSLSQNRLTAQAQCHVSVSCLSREIFLQQMRLKLINDSTCGKTTGRDDRLAAAPIKAAVERCSRKVGTEETPPSMTSEEQCLLMPPDDLQPETDSSGSMIGGDLVAVNASNGMMSDAPESLQPVPIKIHWLNPTSFTTLKKPSFTSLYGKLAIFILTILAYTFLAYTLSTKPARQRKFGPRTKLGSFSDSAHPRDKSSLFNQILAHSYFRRQARYKRLSKLFKLDHQFLSRIYQRGCPQRLDYQRKPTTMAWLEGLEARGLTGSPAQKFGPSGSTLQTLKGNLKRLKKSVSFDSFSYHQNQLGSSSEVEPHCLTPSQYTLVTSSPSLVEESEQAAVQRGFFPKSESDFVAVTNHVANFTESPTWPPHSSEGAEVAAKFLRSPDLAGGQKRLKGLNHQHRQKISLSPFPQKLPHSINACSVPQNKADGPGSIGSHARGASVSLCDAFGLGKGPHDALPGTKGGSDEEAPQSNTEICQPPLLRSTTEEAKGILNPPLSPVAEGAQQPPLAHSQHFFPSQPSTTDPSKQEFFQPLMKQAGHADPSHAAALKREGNHLRTPQGPEVLMLTEAQNSRLYRTNAVQYDPSFREDHNNDHLAAFHGVSTTNYLLNAASHCDSVALPPPPPHVTPPSHRPKILVDLADQKPPRPGFEPPSQLNQLAESLEDESTQKETLLSVPKSNIPKGNLLSEFVENGRFYRTFKDITLIGRGGFGCVYRVRHRFEPNFPQYAVKFIHLNVRGSANISAERCFREVSANRDLFSKQVVRYFTWWCEEPQFLPFIDKASSDKTDMDRNAASCVTHEDSLPSSSESSISSTSSQDAGGHSDDVDEPKHLGLGECTENPAHQFPPNPEQRATEKPSYERGECCPSQKALQQDVPKKPEDHDISLYEKLKRQLQAPLKLRLKDSPHEPEDFGGLLANVQREDPSSADKHPTSSTKASSKRGQKFSSATLHSWASLGKLTNKWLGSSNKSGSLQHLCEDSSQRMQPQLDCVESSHRAGPPTLSPDHVSLPLLGQADTLIPLHEDFYLIHPLIQKTLSTTAVRRSLPASVGHAPTSHELPPDQQGDDAPADESSKTRVSVNEAYGAPNEKRWLRGDDDDDDDFIVFADESGSTLKHTFPSKVSNSSSNMLAGSERRSPSQLRLDQGKANHLVLPAGAKVYPQENEPRFPLALIIQMELIGGMTLRQWLDRPSRPSRAEDLVNQIMKRSNTPNKRSPFPIEICFMRLLMRGLKDIHKHGIVHRDIKPENIFVNENPLWLKIGDFGLARFTAAETMSDQVQKQLYADPTSVKDNNNMPFARVDSVRSVKGLVIGTPCYVAPEGGALCTEKADIYSASLIFLEVLCPRFTTNMERLKVLEACRNHHSIPEHIMDNFGHWGSLILSMSSYNPKDRPSAATVKDLIKTKHLGLQVYQLLKKGFGHDLPLSHAFTPPISR